MPITQGSYTIIKKDKLGEGFYSLWVDCPDITSVATPGQFVHLRIPGVLLRRPISVCETSGGLLRLVFEVRGAGTARLAELVSGEKVDLLGPLGNGFSLLERSARAVVVGGGIGSPPLLAIARHYSHPKVFLGFRSAKSTILCDDFVAAGARLTLATEDGSAGCPGFVTAPLESYLLSNGADIIYACGPAGLLKAVQALAVQHGLRAQLSLEERMACGVGACLGCAVAIRRGQGEQVYLRVCKEGPVFSAEEVVF